MSLDGKDQPKGAKKLKNYILNAAVLAVSCIVAYAIGEFIVRTWIPQPMLPRYVTDSPYGIRANLPNMSYWHTSREYRVNVRTNSHGVRSDREIPYTKPPGTFRIVGLGDSFALGYEVDVEDTYLYQLEKKLHERGLNNVEVINLAVSGFGTAEELIMLREEGLKYSPDLVVLGYFINDIENNVTSNLFSLQGDTLRRESMTYLPAIGIRKTLDGISGYRFLAENSQLLNIFRNYLSYLIQKGLYDRKRNLKSKPVASSEDQSSSLSDSTVTLFESRLTARLLDELYLECDSHGMPLVILNIPLALSTSKEIYSNIPQSQMHYAQRVVYVDAAKILAPYQGKKMIHWEGWHAHWRPWVHHLVAQVMTDTIATHFDEFEKKRNNYTHFSHP